MGKACAKVGISGSKTFIAAAASGPKEYIFAETLIKLSAAADGSFAPTMQFKKLEIHTVFRRFLNFYLRQNLSPSALANLIIASYFKEYEAMKKSNFKKWLSTVACLVLIAALALTVCACAKAPKQPETTGLEDGKTYGQGSTSFPLEVTGSDGKKIAVTILTDKTIVGEALQELGILAGEEGTYGLYIKTVNGETLDYETHGMYWAFYIDGAYAPTGVDQTNIEPGVTYSLVAEKG